ncbi:MAG: hypothetical protein HGB12_00310 [Bacteroidetes bacterium]|nr:hypothetical protein [Bacteroidota bacterium]
MKISLLLATRGRLEKLKKCLQSIIDTVNDPENIEIVFGYDVDEEDQLYEFFQKLDVNDLELDYQLHQFKRPYHLNDKFNYLGQMANNELLFAVSNDLEFKTKDWDKIIIDKFKSDTKDKIFCRWINDGAGSETLPRHYIVHKNYLQVTRNYSCHMLKHYFSDNWIYYVFSKLGKTEYLKEIEVEHSSPVLMKVEPDQLIIDEMNNWFAYDQAVYQGTQGLRDLEVSKLKSYIDNYKE